MTEEELTAAIEAAGLKVGLRPTDSLYHEVVNKRVREIAEDVFNEMLDRPLVPTTVPTSPVDGQIAILNGQPHVYLSGDWICGVDPRNRPIRSRIQEFLTFKNSNSILGDDRLAEKLEELFR